MASPVVFSRWKRWQKNIKKLALVIVSSAVLLTVNRLHVVLLFVIVLSVCILNVFMLIIVMISVNCQT